MRLVVDLLDSEDSSVYAYDIASKPETAAGAALRTSLAAATPKDKGW